MHRVRASAIAEYLVIVSGVVLLIVGWKLFWFLTDDAYITFRYASNFMNGWGLTWNPPPFRPVEGYTNFLWLLCLIGVWQFVGIEPPESANILSLFFGLAQYALIVRWLRTRLESFDAGRRLAYLGLFVALLVTNRSFLTWLSSGLETALFNFLILGWVAAICEYQRGRGYRALLAQLLLAGLIALCRPDGLLFYGASGLICLLAVWGEWKSLPARRWLLLGLAAAAVPVHVLGRILYYGDVFPNTYYAKVGSAWPEAGLRYLASFVVEFGLYVPLIALGGIAALYWKRLFRLEVWGRNRFVLVCATCLILHLAYYVLKVGGDHFEYRVLNHWTALLVMLACSVLVRFREARLTSYSVLILWLLLSLPIPWGHWWLSKDLMTRRSTQSLSIGMADALPFAFPGVRSWDDWQAYLIRHQVGKRHQEHKVFHLYQEAVWPSREQGAALQWSERHLMSEGSVGVPAWVLPRVAVLDVLGLNDYRIAHAPLEVANEMRSMAHDRIASEEYRLCFEANITRPRVRGEDRLVLPLPPVDLTGLKIRARRRSAVEYDRLVERCETKDYDRVVLTIREGLGPPKRKRAPRTD